MLRKKSFRRGLLLWSPAIHKTFNQNVACVAGRHKALPLQNNYREISAKQCQTLSEARYQIENETRQRFADLGVTKANQKLEKWWELNFQAFRDELKKTYKSEIPVKERGEWQTFLEESMTKRAALDSQIRLLEKELNVLVYELFGLTSDEVEIIEGEK